MKTAPLFALAALVLVVSGCNRPAATSAASAPSKGTIAFIDAAAAAKSLGRDLAIDKEITAENAALSDKLNKEKADFQAKFNESRQSAGDKPSQEDTKKLVDLEQQLNTELQRDYQKATNDLELKKLDLIRQFREELKPVAKKVAASQGYTTVLLMNDTVLSYDPATDITKDVVGEMISSGKGAATPAATATP